MKKFLSMVLALVMTMSLVTISAGAKSFTDDSKITYKEAVDVISEIGVVDGYTDGAFNPQNTLTRGAAAKIICNLVLGPTTASALTADAAPFKDVPANHEFAGYIAYCAQQGIINGYADGTFRPAGTLNGYAFMKMLLGALGYDGEIEGFTGANWTINVAKLALGIKLNAGLSDEFNGNEAVNREEACLFAFNTLQADMVQYDSKITANVNGAEVIIGNSKAEVADQGVYDDTMDAKGLQFAERFFPKLTKTKNDTDPFGRPAAEWKYKANIIGSYADYSDLLQTYTAKAEKGDLFSLIGSSVVNGLEDADYDLTVYVDGKEITKSAVSNYFVKNSSSAAGVSGNGVLTEVFMDDDNNVTVVQVNTYLVKATADYNETKESLSIETVDINTDDDAPVMPSFSTTIDNDDVAVSDFKEDDYILVTYSYMDKAIKSAVKAEMVTGEVSEFTETSEVIMDGTTYKYNKLVGKNESKTEYTIGEDAKVVVDAYGYIIYIDDALSTSSYVYIWDVGSSSLTGKTAIGNAYFTDGTYEEITIKKVDGETGSTYTMAADGWYTFSKDSAGKYTLNSVKSPLTYAVGNVKSANVELIKNDAVRFMPNVTGTYDKDLTTKVDNVNTNQVRGDSSTIFVVLEADDTVNVYTGVANAPDVKTSASINTIAGVTVSAVVKASNGYAKYVFVDLSKDAGAIVEDSNTAADYMFLLKWTGNKTTSGEDTYYKYKVVIDGQETEKYVESNITGVDGEGMLLRDVKENAKGYVTGAKVFEDADKRDVIDLSGDVIVYSNDTLNVAGHDYIIGKDCTVTLALGKNANLDLVNEGDSYTLYQTSAKNAANIVKGYDLDGTVYLAVDDKDSEVATHIYIWVSKAVSNDGSPSPTPGGDDKLPGTSDLVVNTSAQAGDSLAGRYNEAKGELYLQFTGLNAKAATSKVALTIADSTGKTLIGDYIFEKDDTASNVSKILTVPFTARDNATAINVAATSADAVDSWYVTYTGADFINKTETVKNVDNTEFTFTVKKPAGAASFNIADNGSAGVDGFAPTLPANSNTDDVTFKALLNGTTTAPEVKLTVTASGLAVSSSVKTGAYSLDNGVTNAAIPASTTLDSAGGNVALTVYLTGAATDTDKIVVKYTVDGAEKTVTHDCTAATAQTFDLGTDALTGPATLEVTSIELQAKVGITAEISAKDNMTGAGSVVVKNGSATVANNAMVAVGTELTVEATAGTMTATNKTELQLNSAGEKKLVNAAGDKVTFAYTVVSGTNTIAVTASDKT